MAEAVKPVQLKSKKLEILEKKEVVEDEPVVSDPLTDAALTARLNSLSTFINNLEPSSAIVESTAPPMEPPVDQPTAPPLIQPETPKTSQYYDLVSEKASNEENVGFRKLIVDVNAIKLGQEAEKSAIKSSPVSTISEETVKPVTIDYNIERIQSNVQVHYPRLNWNKPIVKAGSDLTDESIDWELNRFYEADLICKELEVYYKCKYMQGQLVDKIVDEFVERHSMLDEFKYRLMGNEQRQNAEFYELVKDYYEARRLVVKCQKHIGEFKRSVVVANMKKIWQFEKYTIESFGTCGDQQRVKHELTSEKAYLNKLELNKLQMNLYEMRFNLVKNGLISSLFCSKLAKFKIESYLNEFLYRFKRTNDAHANSTDLQTIIDILFYFYRKHTRVGSRIPGALGDGGTATMTSSYYDPDDDGSSTRPDNEPPPVVDDTDDDDSVDQMLKIDLATWIKTLGCLLINHTDLYRSNTASTNFAAASLLYFDNCNFILEHLLRAPDCFQFSHLFQFPLISVSSLVKKFKVEINSSKSDPLINLYFDGYLRLMVPFSRPIQRRDAFLFLTKPKIETLKRRMNKQADKCWQFIDLEGETENLESLLVEISEDDLLQLYYQIPFNSLFKFLWSYYQSQEGAGDAAGPIEFRKRYVSMKIISFLDSLVRLSLRSLLVYNKLKYKNFCKLIGKTLREIIKFLSTMLAITRDAIRDNYESFLKRIVSTIIYSSRLRSIRWTLLSHLKIGKLDLGSKWLLLAVMCGIDVYYTGFDDVFRSKLETSAVADYIMQSCRNDLEAILNDKPSNGDDPNSNEISTNSNIDVEWLSFMRTLHFLIDLDNDETSVEISDQMFEFMSCVSRVIFKVAYCYKTTKDVCHKEGNSLLSAICSCYPSLIGVILNEIDVDLIQVGKQALFLSDQLPFQKWLPYINCRSDIAFIEKSLLSQPTNSVLFRLATNIIDALDLDMDTSAKSRQYVSSSPSPSLTVSIQTFGFVDLKLIVKLRLAIILFELHSRLTVYNYFTRTGGQFEEIVDTSGNDGTQNRARREDLVSHYSQLAKDKRAGILYWIWQQFYRMRLFYQLSSLKQIDYLDELGRLYAREAKRRTDGSQSSGFMKFYQIYLSKRPDEIFENTNAGNSSDIPATIPSPITVLQPKCPLECYLRLIFTYSGHDLNYIFEHSLSLINVILSTNKKFNKDSKLQTLTYMMLFDWLEAIIYKYSVIDADKESVNQLIDELRAAKKQNSDRLAQLILVLFNPSQLKLIDQYCAKLYRSLKVLGSAIKSASPRENLKKRRIAEENFQNYLYMWIEILITSVKQWHKYKSIVKIIDFLVAFSFQTEMSDKFIHLDMLNELFNYVRSDFGVVVNSDESLPHDQAQPVASENNTGAGGGWGIAPSINWLSSSLTYVVTNTVGAAIGMGSNSSDFFDSGGPIQQQFAYDKRLYKECPYIGFYLSLCEERIESQLGLWSSFLQSLLNPPSDIQHSSSSSNFVEACWRRTLSNVNKSNGLHLNFSWYRLMMFKWCERALELPHDHPLLILYWQKFFNIYLDKEYISAVQSSSRPIYPNPNRRNNEFDIEMTPDGPSNSQSTGIQQSPTFRLFTSTSQMNSLLKQLKKQLELTSQHYAYQLSTPNPSSSSSSQSASAPVSSYHFNELVSKLYYALSLWVDETRLHDPNLYLPALPAHYEPNLLAKVFSRQCDFWVEYIDLRFVNEHINSVIIIGTNEKPSGLKSASSSSQNDGLFFNEPDRMHNQLPGLNQINLGFRFPLREKFGESIENLLKSNSSDGGNDQIDLVVNVCEHLLKSIFKYNKDFINHSLNHMLKLDDKLTNKLLVHLWHNEECEKYVQVGCTSIINPIHECSRPAMVKFVYEVATKRDQIKEEIRENRQNHDKLIANFMEPDSNSYDLMNKFPHDDIVVSMVAMTQLIKKLLINSHAQQQQTQQASDQNPSNLLLTRLYYLLIEIYENQMNHPNDVLNPAKSNSASPMHITGWSILVQSELQSLEEPLSLTTTNQINSDSIHLFMFDLINLIGSNFIQNNGIRNMKKSNQQLLLEKIIKKLTTNINLSSVIERNGGSASAISTRRSSNMLLNLTRNKLSLMSLCAQFVEPNDLDLFNEFYTKILASISSILLNDINQNGSSAIPAIVEPPTEDSSAVDLPKLDENEMINQKFGIILQLLSKFSFINLSRLLESSGADTKSGSIAEICTQFVTININFLTDLNLECLNGNPPDSDASMEQMVKRDQSLKLIIDQCIDNFVSILNVSYPFYFDLILKRCFEFTSRPFVSKYGSRHLSRLTTIVQQNELAGNLSASDSGRFLTRAHTEATFRYIGEFFSFERTKFRSQKRSFYSHWAQFARPLAHFFSTIISNYFDKFIAKEMSTNISRFETIIEGLFGKLVEIFSCWIEPASVIEVTSAVQINVKEVYEQEVSSVGARDELLKASLSVTTPQSAVLIMIDSFLDTFNTLLLRFVPFSTPTHPEITIKNYALNSLIHYYYERIACELNASTAVNDNTLDCYHRCMRKYSSSWYGSGGFEPDYQTVQIMSELCHAHNARLVKHLAYDLVGYFNLARITESYFRAASITPSQINDLLKCILQTLGEFCLRDYVRESRRFEIVLRPVYNQAEVLQCWSMLSDAAYSSVVIDRFCASADYLYAFASRGTDRGLLMMVLKSAAEFYTLADRNSLSCFASAKRRCYLKAVCTLLLKPSIQTIRQESEAFQNCVINLLTDIETFSISAAGGNQLDDDAASLNLKHEIQLLIDECLVLIVSGAGGIRQPVYDQYRSMFESWLTSSKDSPVLIHFINRISKNYNLLIAATNSEIYCNLLELCLEVFFETDREQSGDKSHHELQIEPNAKSSIGWSTIMNELEFKLNSANNDSHPDLFEYKLLQHSSYLILNAYMTQRAALIKASSSGESDHMASIINYCENILGSFFQAGTSMLSRPRTGKEEKFILVVNRLLELLLSAMYSSRVFEHKIGELLVRLASLLIYYSEDSLSTQNPTNDNQSLLSSIGININILAKKSPYSIKFRFYTRCMAICIIKQVMIVDDGDCSNKPGLFPALSNKSGPKWVYKVRLSGSDGPNSGGRNISGVQFENSANNHLSTSMPNSSPLTSSTSTSELHNVYAPLLKQAAYQFHLIFQTKSYSTVPGLVDLANGVNQSLQNTAAGSVHFCLPQCLNMSKHLCAQLFNDKFYLFP